MGPSFANIELDPQTPHPLEVSGFPDFFVDRQTHGVATSTAPQHSNKKVKNLASTPRTQKNAERYMKIRNTILDEWNRVKPEYLLKSACRPLLKGHGDVHAISRIHEFLERLGCINVDHEGASIKTNKRKGDSTGFSDDTQVNSLPLEKIHKGDVSRRQKRIRNSKGEWVDPSEIRDGRTIVHGEDGRALSEEEPDSQEALAEERRMLAKNAKYFSDAELAKHDPALVKRKRKQLQRQFYYYGNDTDDDLNEFRLVPLKQFVKHEPPLTTDSLEAPFRVIIQSNVQLLIDFHAHLSEDEIIGLLGGTYDPLEKVLMVQEVFPCRSISTTIQCEMDPESEVKAHLHFSSMDKAVVGWYHSHPTFDPNPSIRDIETQTDHQHLFLREQDGIEPFVGAIYSPYDPRTLGVVSKSEWMCVGREMSQSGKYRLPFSCEYTITPSDGIPTSVVEQVDQLIREYGQHQRRVDLFQLYREGTSRLDKILGALQVHSFAAINLEGEDVSDRIQSAEAFIATVKEKLLAAFSAASEI